MADNFCAKSGIGWQLCAHNQWTFNYKHINYYYVK